MSSKYRDALVRAARTFGQGALGVFVLLAIPVLNGLIQTVTGGGDIEIDLNLWQNIAVACIAGGVIALVALIQNLLEDKTGKTALK